MYLSSKSSIISWWIQGLKLLVPAWLKTIFNPAKKRILIRYQSDQLMVIWPNKKNSNTRTDLYYLKQLSERKKLSKNLARYSKDKHNVVLCISAKKGLRNNIKLPVKAESDLASILDFEIDRQTPFTREQVYSGFRLIDKNLTANSLVIELNVIPKKHVDPQLNLLKKVGIIPQAVELLGDKPGPRVNVLPGTIVNGDYQGSRYLNKLLCLLVVILSGIVIALPFRDLELAIRQTESDIEEARSVAMDVNELRSKWTKTQEKQDFMNETIDEHRSVTVVLDELTRLIPDDTWLNRLHIKGETIRLQGESSAATTLIRIIENSEGFSGTRFRSPVTSNTVTGNDRFQIMTNNVMQVLPQVSSK